MNIYIYEYSWLSIHSPDIPIISPLRFCPLRSLLHRMSILSASPVVLSPERCAKQLVDYPMVNIQKAIENHHFE